jgi:lipoprotein-anchoring transpeptidase ErfK/SrfK
MDLRSLTMDLVHVSRAKRLSLAAFAAALVCVPVVARAETPPQRDEAVVIDRYLMGRVRPSPTARGAVRLWTNTGYSDRRAVYPVLEHAAGANGTDWVKVRVERRPRNAEVWIPGWATRRIWISWRITIDLSSRTARVYREGSLARRMRVVVGAPSTPTPTGHFYVVDHLRLYNNWAHGVWALATSAYSMALMHFDGGNGVVALHGRGYLTAPVGTAASHGCVRFNDGDIRWMAAHIQNGTRIDIKR